MKVFLFYCFICFNVTVISQVTLQQQLIDLYAQNIIQGKVNYANLLENPLALDKILNEYALNPIPSEGKKAYLINAYNIFVIAGIVENYPIATVQNIPNFFDNPQFVLAEKMISLNTLEKKYLLQNYPDPRLHFVLVCGAIGCPPLSKNVFTASNIEAMLEKQTKQALNSGFIQYDTANNAVALSQIFKWYADDFGGKQTQIISFINEYRDAPLPSNVKVNYYDYDWSLNGLDVFAPNVTTLAIPNTNLQTFTAGSLLSKNQYDITLFNTLYTESAKNFGGIDYNNYRSTFVTHLAQITYGVSNNKRINLGIDLNFKYSGEVSNSPNFSGIAEAFKFKNTATSRVGLTNIGLRFKAQPFKNSPEFTLQSTLQIPTIKNPEGTQDLFWADWDRITWWNQFYYAKTWDKFQLFTEFDLLFRLKKYKEQISMLDMPLSVFLSYFPKPKFTFYIMSQHVPRFTYDIFPNTSTDWVIPANYTASGLGIKYQFHKQMNIELLYTNFWRGVNNGIGNTFNIGIKFISL